MKLEEGMYVRTFGGNIDKIESFKSSLHHDYIETPYRYLINKKDIKKASHNIIDLIEEGDYVNGEMVMEADWNNDNDEYEEGLAFPLYDGEDKDVIVNWQPLKYTKIKSIVTKVQFEAIKYDVE